MNNDERRIHADAYLGTVINSIQGRTHIRLRDILDPWFAFETGNDLDSGARFLTGGGQPHTFNNPCPWQHWKTLRHPHFWVSASADEVLSRAQSKDRTVRKDERDQDDESIRLVVDHAVPLARIMSELNDDRQLLNPDRLRGFLLHHFRRGVLTKSEDQRLNETKVGGIKLSDNMPPDWSAGGNPFARYRAVNPPLERAGTPNLPSANTGSADLHDRQPMELGPIPTDADVEREARVFRLAIETAGQEPWRGHNNMTYPRGCCAHASELLARHLKERLGISTELVSQNVSGEIGGWHGGHAWLEWNGLVIDISGDQFGWPPVIVTRNPVHHRRGDDELRIKAYTDYQWWGRECGALWKGIAPFILRD